MAMKSASISKPSSAATSQGSTKQRADQWRSPSQVATFLRCLHLLNLDLLEDWPGITEQTFSTKSALQNLQQRVKCVEWALYRLFEIYDAADTLQKLRSFFPPSTPLNSLNLRAALLRSLTELKKNGLLGRDVVLRKTSLEECKGEKFEELIGTFAMLVLKTKAGKADREFLGSTSGQSAQHLDDTQLLPLILAHRLSLQDCLQQRREFERKANSYEAFIYGQEEGLRKRRSSVKTMLATETQRELKAIEDKVRDTWTGDDRWIDVLLQGVQSHNLPPQQSFETSWEDIASARSSSSTVSTRSLLDDLDARTAEHEARLKRWSMFRRALENAQKSKAPKPAKLVSNSEPLSGHSSFSKHQSLRLDPSKISHNVGTELLPKHEILLKSMEEQLSKIGQSQRAPGQKTVKEVTGQQFNDDSRATTAVFDSHSSAHSAARMRAVTEYPQSDESQILYQLLTPESNTLYSPNDHLESTLEVYADFREMRLSDDIGIERPGSKSGELDKSTCPTEVVDDLLTPERPLPTSSLSERTQKSMSALLGRDVSSPSQPPSMTAKPVLPTNLPQPDRPTTLLERTRQSMSLLPNPPPKSRKMRESLAKQSRKSQVFPINQFETPGKAKPPPPMRSSPGSGASTPRDKLFSEEAEYASVFKSRPKIALSPALSPERPATGLESLLEEGMMDLSLEDANNSFQDTTDGGWR